MTFSARSSLANLQRDLQRAPSAERDAVRRGINDTLRTMPAVHVQAMRQAFDAITPYTARAIGVQFVAQGGELQGQVYVKARRDVPAASTRPESFLGPNIDGRNGRNLKRLERAAQRVGVMPAGWFAVLGDGARIDPWGNLSRGQVVQIMAFLQLFPSTGGYRQNTSDANKAKRREGTRNRLGFEYFAVQPGKGLRPGIWLRQRGGRAVNFAGPIGKARCVLAFVPKVKYSQRYAFAQVSSTHVERELARNIAARRRGQ